MRIRNVLVFIAAIAFLTNTVLANSDNKVSIALITDKASGLDKSPLVSLLEVELSQKEGIQLLERAAIDKIMQEQQLNAAGLMDRNTSIKIGKLLRANAFIILSLENQAQDTNDLIRVRVSETAHGLRLLDYFEQSESTNPKEAVERIIKKLEAVLKKINQPDEKLIPIGIVDIHRVQLGEQYKMLERTLPVMLSVRLSLEPQIIMLEREDLKVLLDEKLRTEGQDSQFWNSAILIDGYLQPNSGQLEMHLNLKQAAGDNIKSIIVPIEPNESAIAIAKASTEIIQQLQNSPPAIKWQPELEAEQFYKQGQLLSNHQRYEEALPLFETAHSLQPQNVYYTGSLFERIWNIRYKIEYVFMDNESERRIREEWIKNNPGRDVEPLAIKDPETCPYSDIEIAELVSILVRQIREEYGKGTLSSSDIRFNWVDPYGYLDYNLSNSSYFSSYASVSNEQIRLINRENRRIWIEIMNKTVEQSLVNREITQNALAIAKSRLAWISSDDPNEWIENLKKAFTEYVMPPELGGKIKPTSQRREDIFYSAFQLYLENHSSYSENFSFMKGSNELFVKLWRDYLKEMTDVNEPIVKINSYVALALGGLYSDIEEYKIKSHDYGYKAFELIRDTFTNPDNSHNVNIKEQLVTRFKNLTYTEIFDTSERVQLWEEICERLIDQNDNNSLVLLKPGFRPFRVGHTLQLIRDKEIYKQYYLLLDRIASVLQTSVNDKEANAAISNIRDFQSELRNKIPELDISYKTSRTPVTMLLSQKDWPQLPRMKFYEHVGIPIVTNDKMLWIGFSSGATTGYQNSWPIDIGVACIDISQKEATSIWQSQIITSEPVHNLTGLSITPEVIYLSLTNGGIVKFPGSLKNGREYLKALKVITQETNFPSNSVTSIVQAGSNFWVAYGDDKKESGLGLYNPQKNTWETVFCSTLKSNTLFGIGKPYVIHAMKIVSPDKMFFLVYDPTIPKVESRENPEGFWMMNAGTQEMKYLGPLWIDWPQRVNVEYIDRQLWFKSWYFIIKYDLDSEKFTKIIGDTNYLLRLYLEKNIPLTLERELFVPESSMIGFKFGLYLTHGNIDLSTSAIHNDNLWVRLGESQIIIIDKGKSLKEAKIIENNILDGNPVCKFVSTPYGLIGIGEGVVGLIETEK